MSGRKQIDSFIEETLYPATMQLAEWLREEKGVTKLRLNFIQAVQHALSVNSSNYIASLQDISNICKRLCAYYDSTLNSGDEFVYFEEVFIARKRLNTLIKQLRSRSKTRSRTSGGSRRNRY